MLERVARPPPAPSLNRLLGEGLDGTFKRSRSTRGCSHRSGRRNNPQQGSSSRLCRVHSALVQSGRSGGAAAPPEHTEWYGRCWRAEKSCTSREAACAAALALACGRCVFVCLARPPTTAQRSWRARCMRIDTERSEARYREDARPRYRAVGPRGKRTLRAVLAVAWLRKRRMCCTELIRSLYGRARFPTSCRAAPPICTYWLDTGHSVTHSLFENPRTPSRKPGTRALEVEHVNVQP